MFSYYGCIPNDKLINMECYLILKSKTKDMKYILTFVLSLIWLFVFAQEDRHNTSIQNAWLSCTARPGPNPARGSSHWILYDFKDTYSMHESTFWNFNTPARLNNYNFEPWALQELEGDLQDGLKDIFVDISIDGVNWQEWGRFTLPQANGSGFYEGSAGPDFGGKIARFVLITARNNYGGNCYGLSEVRFKATPATISKTDEKEKSPSFISVSPNPASQFIQVGLEGFPTGNVTYNIADISGKVVSSGIWEVAGPWTKSTVDVQSFVNGAYILTVSSKDQTRSVAFEVFK